MSKFYSHTDDVTGNRYLTAKGTDGKWYAYDATSPYLRITGPHKTRKDASYHAVRAMDAANK